MYENAAVMVSAAGEPQYRDMVEPGLPFGAEVIPPPGADVWERLAAFIGRNPRVPAQNGLLVDGLPVRAPEQTTEASGQ